VISLEEQTEGTVQNGQLLIAFACLPKGVPEWKAHEECPRRRGFLGYLQDDGK